MKNHSNTSLWRWISTWVIVMSVSMVVVVAFAMWCIYAVQYIWVVHRMSPALYQEFITLRNNPGLDPVRFHQIVDAGWGFNYSSPSLISPDWGLIAMIIIAMTPFVIWRCLRTARPLSAQFTSLTRAAEVIARGQFNKQVELVRDCPDELQRFTLNFNRMADQLALYERELKASHVAAAHELRSPLTAAIGRLQGMIDKVFPADDTQLSMVMTQLKNLSRLTDDLHFLSLVDAGQLRLQLQIVNLTRLLNERISWLKPQLEAAGMAVTFDEQASYVCEGDAFRLGQVFTILIENMLRYCSPGDRMVISLSRQPNAIDIHFLDNGPGVSAEYLPIMFERFTRGERSRARDSGGSGLGLSIAKAICLAHGGSIKASLPAEKGLLITLSLPLSGSRQRP